MLGRSGVERHSGALLQYCCPWQGKGAAGYPTCRDPKADPSAHGFSYQHCSCMQGRGDVDCGSSVPLQVLLCLGGV